jgi:hypothetical protein
MVKAPSPKLLLTEGRDDLLVVSEVFEKATGLKWEPAPRQFLVEIEWCGSDTEVLRRIDVKWKESGRKILGVVLDADSSGARWLEVRARAPSETRARIPEHLPPEGLVLDMDNGRRFGVWIMPDNQSPGMLETFLLRLRSSMPSALGEHVVSSMQTAKSLMDAHLAGHPDACPPVRSWRHIHRDKAEAHTWLAWQDPPGIRLHEAVRKELLDVQAPLAQAFVGWLRRLYDL